MTTTRLYRSNASSTGTTSGIFRSDDGGHDWIPTASIDDPSITQIAAGNDSRSTVLVAGARGIWRSPDNGASWVLVDGVPPVASGKISIAADFASPGVFFASVEDRFYVSRDAGQTWQPFTQSGFPDEPVLQLAVAQDGELFARTQAAIFELRQVVVDPTTPAGGMVEVGHR